MLVLLSISPLLYTPKSPAQRMISLITSVYPQLNILKIFPTVTLTDESGPNNSSVRLFNK